jgi:hypothetical protein
LKSFYLGVTDVFWVIVGQAIREKDVAIGQFPCSLLGVDVAELHQCTIVTMKPILFHKKWNEDAVNLQNEIFCLYTVKYIVVEEEVYLALDAVGTSNASDLVDFRCCNHDGRMRLMGLMGIVG